MTLTDVHTLAGILESAATLVALLIGGWWSYRLFWTKRQVYPRASLDLDYCLEALQRNALLVRIIARIRNTGDVLIELTRGYINLELLRPCDRTFNDEVAQRQFPDHQTSHELQGPLLQKLRYSPATPCEIEPGEQESIHFDFILPQGPYRLVKAHAYFSNLRKKKREIRWSHQLLINLREFSQQPGGQANVEEARKHQTGGTGASRAREAGD